MECACFSSDCEDYVTMLGEHRRKARKTHKCGECRMPILPGQTYLEERFLFDGVVNTHRTCECCESIRTHLYCQFIFGEVWDELRDQLHYASHYTVDGVPWARFAKLTPEARERVLEVIEEIWEDANDEEEEVEE